MGPSRTPSNLNFHYTHLREAARAKPKERYDKASLDRESLLYMIAVTPPEVKNKSFDVHIIRRYYETGRNEGYQRVRRKQPVIYNQIRAYTRDTSKTGSGEDHKCLIRFFGPPDERTPVWVSCDCAWFKFTAEVALADRNSSDVYFSNGEPPAVRNKAKYPMLCKHLFKVADWALSLKDDKAAKAIDKISEERERQEKRKKGAGVHLGESYSPTPFSRFRR